MSEEIFANMMLEGPRQWLSHVIKLTRYIKKDELEGVGRLSESDVVKAFLATHGSTTVNEIADLIMALRRAGLSERPIADPVTCSKAAYTLLNRLVSEGLAVKRRVVVADALGRQRAAYVYEASEELAHNVFGTVYELLRKLKARMYENAEWEVRELGLK